MTRGKVEVASHDLDLRASRFQRAKEKHRGERSEYIFQAIIAVLPFGLRDRLQAPELEATPVPLQREAKKSDIMALTSH